MSVFSRALFVGSTVSLSAGSLVGRVCSLCGRLFTFVFAMCVRGTAENLLLRARSLCGCLFFSVPVFLRDLCLCVAHVLFLLAFFSLCPPPKKKENRKNRKNKEK